MKLSVYLLLFIEVYIKRLLTVSIEIVCGFVALFATHALYENVLCSFEYT